MARPVNFRRSVQVRLGAEFQSDVDTSKRVTVDKDAVLVLVGEDVPPERVAYLLRLATPKASSPG